MFVHMCVCVCVCVCVYNTNAPWEGPKEGITENSVNGVLLTKKS